MHLNARFPAQKSITLSTLLRAGAAEVPFDALRVAIEAMADKGRAR